MCLEKVVLPRTSSLTTVRRSSLTSFKPVKTFSRAWSSSFLAVATTGTLVVVSSRRANSRPMPREAGVTNAHGCILFYSGSTEAAN